MNLEQQADIDGGPLAILPSIFLRIEEGLRSNPNGPAVVAMHQPADHLADLVEGAHLAEEEDDMNLTCLTWSYLQLHRAAMKSAAGMLANGVRPGSVMVTLIPNRAEYCVLLWTAVIMRLTLASLDFGALAEPRRQELANFMQTLKPDIIVVSGEQGAAAVDEVLREDVSEGARRPLCVRLESGNSDANWITLLDVGRAGLAYSHSFDEHTLLDKAKNDNPTRTCLILFTSGTSSGKPKGCPRDVASVAHHVDAHTWNPDGAQTSKILLINANFRIIAPARCLATWKHGGVIVIPGESFAPATALDAIEQHGITTMLFAPATVHALIGHTSFRARKTETVRSIVIAGDIITRSLLAETTKAFPSATVSVAHGMTEGGGMYSWPFYHTPIDEIPYYGEIAPLGNVSQGARVRIWSHDAARVSWRGEPGEMQICCPTLVTHYLDNVNADSFYTDDHDRQWFKTGDLGMINNEGLVYILGRIKDVIKRAGVPITPTALESAIEEFTGLQASVLAIPSAALGQEPYAVLSSSSSKPEAQIKQRVLDLFGKDYALAGAVSLSQLGFTSGFPLNSTGKVMKVDLLKAVEAHLNGASR